MAQAKESVAFLGIGTMGHAMATRTLRAGIPTIVWNRDPGVTRDLVESWRGGGRFPRGCSPTAAHCGHDGDGR